MNVALLSAALCGSGFSRTRSAWRRTLLPARSPGAAPYSCARDYRPNHREHDESDHDAPERRGLQHAQQLFSVLMRQQRCDAEANRAHDREDAEEPPRADLERTARQHERAQRKGGWSSAGRANAIAPVLFSRALSRSNRRAGTSFSRPASPIFRPIQYVNPAPTTDPAVVSSG